MMRVWVVWNNYAAEGRDGWTAIWAVDKLDAIVKACVLYGYDMRKLARRREGPCDVVRVLKVVAFDRYAKQGNDKALGAAIDKLPRRVRVDAVSAAERKQERRDLLHKEVIEISGES